MPRTAATLTLPPEGKGDIVAPEVSFEPVKEVTTMTVDTDTEEDAELLDCGCSVDNTRCADCDDNGESTCISCCNVSHCAKCSADLDHVGCEQCGDVCVDCCEIVHCDCGSDLDESGCGYKEDVCTMCCGCYYCESCGEHKGQEPDPDNYCYDCNHCSGCECACEGSGDGQIKIAPWEARGIQVSTLLWREHAIEAGQDYMGGVPEWPKLWNIDQTIAPAEAMCDFYLLDGIASGVLNGGPNILDDPDCATIAGEAKAWQNALVERLDITFTNYVDMAVGGELRHHKAVGKSALRLDRTAAWADWFYLRQLIGPQALLDAATVFRDFQKSGFGGEPWALPCELLHQRLTGRLTPHIFVDRVFTMQHNGGSLLNKIDWGRSDAGWTFQTMKCLGDAHAANPPGWGPLLAGASVKVTELFAQWWRAANRWRRMRLMEREPAPTWRTGGRRDYRTYWWDEFYGLQIDLVHHPRWGWYEQGEWTLGDLGFLFTPYVPDLDRLSKTGKFTYQDLAFTWYADENDWVHAVCRKGIFAGVSCMVSDVSIYRQTFAEMWHQEKNKAEQAKNKKLAPTKVKTTSLADSYAMPISYQTPTFSSEMAYVPGTYTQDMSTGKITYQMSSVSSTWTNWGPTSLADANASAIVKVEAKAAAYTKASKIVDMIVNDEEGDDDE